MKNLILTLPILILLGCATSEPAVQAPEQYSIEQFYENVSLGGGNFSSDEDKLLISSNESGIYNLYEIDIASGGECSIEKSVATPDVGLPGGGVDGIDCIFYDGVTGRSSELARIPVTSALPSGGTLRPAKGGSSAFGRI